MSIPLEDSIVNHHRFTVYDFYFWQAWTVWNETANNFIVTDNNIVAEFV